MFFNGERMTSTLFINGKTSQKGRERSRVKRKEKGHQISGKPKGVTGNLDELKKVFHTEKVRSNDKNRRPNIDRQTFECFEIEIFNLVFESDKICKTRIL